MANKPCVMRKGLIGVMAAALLVPLFSLTAVGYQAYGWDEIRACLLDGDGSEFIVPVSWVPPCRDGVRAGPRCGELRC